MWNCPKCLNENSSTANFCAYCGLAGPSAAESEDKLRASFAAANKKSLRTNAAFPVRVPVLLQMPESSTRFLAAILGIFSGGLLAVLFFSLANPSGMTGRLFNLKNPFGAVPLAILIAFFWGLFICLMRYLRVRAQTKLSHESLLIDSIEVAEQDGIARLVWELEEPMVQHSALLRRLQIVTRHWLQSPGLQDADVLLQQQQYGDEENVRAGYSLVRAFVWALPVFGLVGTVAGVAVAIGGFAEFLGGNIEDVTVIKQSLVNVTAGLSYAFLTTLYGLTTALVLMLLTTALQGREEKLYATVHQKIVDHFLPALQRIAPEKKRDDVLSIPGLQEQLITISREVLEFVRDQGSLTLQSFSEERSVLAQNVLDWGKLLRDEAIQGAQNIAQALDAVGIRMSNAHFDFLQKFEATKSQIESNATSLLHSTAELSETIVARQETLLRLISAQSAIIERNGEVFSDLKLTSNQTLQLYSSMNEAIGMLKNVNFDDSAREIVEAIDRQKQEITSVASALNRSSEITKEVLSAQADLNESVAKLHDIQLDNTLREFRDSLLGLKPVLENLKEPFILQAVPITNGRGTS